jgi:hypothetical protein
MVPIPILLVHVLSRPLRPELDIRLVGPTTGATKGGLFDEIKKEEEDDEDDDDEDGTDGDGIKSERDGEGEVDEFGRRIREEDRRRKKGLLTSYKFKVCDSLLNIGPITDFAIGESFDAASVSMAVQPLPLSHAVASRRAVPILRCAELGAAQEQEGQRSVEIVTCSGQGKNGSLCVLQVSSTLSKQHEGGSFKLAQS